MWRLIRTIATGIVLAIVLSLALYGLRSLIVAARGSGEEYFIDLPRLIDAASAKDDRDRRHSSDEWSGGSFDDGPWSGGSFDCRTTRCPPRTFPADKKNSHNKLPAEKSLPRKGN